jgi:hypothetical protein
MNSNIEQYKYTINELKNVILNNKLVILYFYSDDFKLLNDKMAQFNNNNNNNNNNKYKFIKINYIFNENIIDKMCIKSVPLFRIYKNQEFIEEIFGNYDNIIDIIKIHITD